MLIISDTVHFPIWYGTGLLDAPHKIPCLYIFGIYFAADHQISGSQLGIHTICQDNHGKYSANIRHLIFVCNTFDNKGTVDKQKWNQNETEEGSDQSADPMNNRSSLFSHFSLQICDRLYYNRTKPKKDGFAHSSAF